LSSVHKRDGRIVDFDFSRIVNVINKAMSETIDGVDEKLSKRIAESIKKEIVENDEIKTVEQIQDMIEEKLMGSNRKDVAKKYILFREFRNQNREENKDTESQYKLLDDEFISQYKHKPSPMTPLGEFVYYRTYSRWLPEQKRREYWWETCRRAVEFNCGLVDGVTKEEAQELFDNMFNLKQFLSGRSLWSGFTKASYANPASQFNCFTGDTEFLSKGGIRQFKDCKDGELVSILDGNCGWSEAKVKHFDEDEIVEIKLRRKGTKTTKIIKTTKNHIWFVRKFPKDTHYIEIKTEDLKIGSILKMRTAYCKTKIDMCPIGIQHGIVYGDGNLEKERDYCLVKLIGHKQELLKYFYSKDTWYDKTVDGTMVRQLPNTWKKLPDTSMNVQYIKGFLYGLLLTDGRVGSSIRITQRTEEEVKYIRGLFEMIGMPTSEVTESVRTNSNYGEYENPYTFSIFKEYIPHDWNDLLKETIPEKRDWIVEEINYNGDFEKTYCIIESKTNSFTLTSGIHTHNCSFLVIDEFEAYKDICYLLMLGCGVGFSVEDKFVSQLPKVRGNVQLIHQPYRGLPKHKRKEVTDYTVISNVIEINVGDSKNAWSLAIDIFLKVFYDNDFQTIDNIIMNYDSVRPFGERLKTFGGQSSGHDALLKIIDKIHKVLTKNNKSYKKLKPIDAMDIANSIAEGIVVGGTRRSAQMCLFDSTDKEVMNAKSNLYTMDENGIWSANPDIVHRMMSNNSVTYYEKPNLDELRKRFETIRHSAEGNFFNMEAALKRNPNAKGTNP